MSGCEDLNVELLKIILTALLLLLVGDLISTFFDRVPEHIFGKFHSLVHHGKNRSFIHYAVLTKNPLVLLYGFIGALPYLISIPWLWNISPLGTILGLLLGEFHVSWRQISILDWPTPVLIQRWCHVFYITTPERHWRHHEDARVAFGDIFTFYDRPAQWWFQVLLSLKLKFKQVSDREV